MSNYENDLRIFQEMRKHPWIPEHKQFIDEEIARLGVRDKTAAESFRKQYDEKLAAYLKEQKTEEVEPKFDTKVEPKAETVEKKVESKKKTKKSK